MKPKTLESQCELELIAVDGMGRLLLRPKVNRADFFTHIYRDASGVEWDDDTRSLCAAEPGRWDHFSLFMQIISAVRNEYGRHLIVTPTTQWENIPNGLKDQMSTCPESRPIEEPFK